MTVRAKFKVSEKTEHAAGGDPRVNVKLEAVCDGSDENKAFWEATPNGQLELGWISKAAADQLVTGREYYLDITPAD